MTQDLERLAAATAAVVGSYLPKITRTPKFCIMAARCSADVLRYFDVQARPVSVDLKVMNAAMATLLDAYFRGDGPAPDREAMDAVGAWLIALEHSGQIDRQAGTWNGHLVTAVDGFLVDASFGQFDRPLYDMPAPPGILARPADTGQPDQFLWENGQTLAAYTLRPEDRSYTQAADWQRHKRLRPDVGKMIRQVRTIMEEA